MSANSIRVDTDVTEEIYVTPLVPVAGVVWRWCRFRIVDVWSVDAQFPDRTVRVKVPAELNQAVPKRRAEFLAGRLCAQLAIGEFDTSGEVGRDGRRPTWPPGIVGSISHSLCLAAAATSREFSGLGIDCEALLDESAMAEVGPMIMQPDEIGLRPTYFSGLVYATLVFSAKESLYKALALDPADIPNFHDASIKGVTETSVQISFRDMQAAVAYRIFEDHVVTIAALDVDAY